MHVTVRLEASSLWLVHSTDSWNPPSQGIRRSLIASHLAAGTIEFRLRMDSFSEGWSNVCLLMALVQANLQ